MKVVVVIPTYNEALNLPELVRGLMGQDIPGLEILIVDDNSPDGTGQLAQEIGQQYPGRIEVVHRSGKLGLGSAYILGFNRALQKGADHIIEMDADLSHPPECLPVFLEKCRDADVVAGSRYVPGGKADPSWGLLRRLLSRGGGLYARRVLGLKVKDPTSGYKCFRRKALERLSIDRIKSEGFAFQIEMAYICQKSNLRVVEVPIFFRDRTKGRSKLSSGIVLEALWRVWEIKGRYRSVSP